MNDGIMLRVALVCLLLITCSFGCSQEPTWAKKATTFPEQCASWYPSKAQPCKPVRVVAPDGKRSVQVRYRKRLVSATAWLLQAYIRVTVQGNESPETALPESFQNVDLLWSPDSRAFFVDGDGDGAPVSGFWVYVYLADDPAHPLNVTENARRDMLNEFPASKAAYPNAEDLTGCKTGSRDQVRMDADSINVTAIEWLTPSSVLVMAQIPCDTLFGGIMCQVMGYELEVPTGRIIKRIDAKHLKREWQSSIARIFRIPEAPKYCPASDTSKGSDNGSTRRCT